MSKLTCNKVKEFIKDEKMGNREYRKYNLTNLAKDESKHKRFLLKKEKEIC